MSTMSNTLKAATSSSDELWDPSWKESYGEATIQKRSETTHERKLYCGWYCPFAQRAWIALEEMQLPYQYVECNPYEVDPQLPGGYTKKALPLTTKKNLQPDFIATSPRGLVPALQDVNGMRVWESSAIVEYLDDMYGSNNDEQGRRLMPTDPQARALVRIFVDHCTNRIQKAYYTWLMEQSTAGQQAAQKDFFMECRVLAAAMAPTTDSNNNHAAVMPEHSKMDTKAVQDIANHVHSSSQPGPYFLGDTVSAVDIGLAPFWQRFLWVGSHYRNLQFPTSEQDPAFARLHLWWKAISQRPSVQATLVCKERLISSYGQYARNEGTSDYAVSLQSSLTSTLQSMASAAAGK